MAAGAVGNSMSAALPSFLPSLTNEAASMFSNNVLPPFMAAALSAAVTANSGNTNEAHNNTDDTPNVANTAAARMQLDTAALWMLRSTCPICQASFQNAQELQRHFETHLAAMMEATLNAADNAPSISKDSNTESRVSEKHSENESVNDNVNHFIENSQDLLRIASKNLSSKPKVLV